MSQWAEVRHLHLVEGVPKKEIARRLKLDVKTVRRAIGRPTPPVRVSPQRVRSLDSWQKQIEEWLRDDRRLTAKRVRRLLLPLAGTVSQRTVRRYVAALKSEVKPKEAFVHRSALPGATMEVEGDEMAQNGGLRPSPYSVFLHESCRYPALAGQHPEAHAAGGQAPARC